MLLKILKWSYFFLVVGMVLQLEGLSVIQSFFIIGALGGGFVIIVSLIEENMEEG